MTFTPAESAYLASQHLGRLATVTADGKPQIVTVGFRINEDATIDIGGPTPTLQRYRNVRANPHVSLVIDDMTPNDPNELKPGWGRGVEIRGAGEILEVETPPVNPEWFSHTVIRVHANRIRSWHIDPADPDGGARNVS